MLGKREESFSKLLSFFNAFTYHFGIMSLRSRTPDVESNFRNLINCYKIHQIHWKNWEKRYRLKFERNDLVEWPGSYPLPYDPHIFYFPFFPFISPGGVLNLRFFLCLSLPITAVNIFVPHLSCQGPKGKQKYRVN